MLTCVPLPRWKELASAFLKANSNPTILVKPWMRDGDRPFLFARSSHAMQAVIKWWEQCFNASPQVWVPDYFCNQSLIFVRKTSAKLIFYPIDKELQPQWQACAELAAKHGSPDMFFLVHYFGYPSGVQKSRNFCNKHNALLVEDAAHVLRPINGVGELGDLVFYSPHKLLPTPEGSVLLMRPSSLCFRGADSNSSREVMDYISKQGQSSSKWPTKYIAKRVVQKIIPDWFISLLQRKDTLQFDIDANGGDSPESLSLLHPACYNMLAQAAHNLSEIAIIRQKNASLIKHLIAGYNDITPFFSGSDEKIVPYLFVIKSENFAVCKKRFKEFRDKGIPVLPWPDLPPEVMSNPVFHATAIELRNTIFTLPVHQTLPIDSLIHKFADCTTASRIFKAVGEYKIVDFAGDGSKWNDYLIAVGKSNILQSWEYGQAKASLQGLKVQHYLVLKGDRPVAFFQALVKQIPLVGGVIRVNRGPLWLIDRPEQIDISNVFKLIRRRWSLQKRWILSIAPEISDSPEHIVTFCQLGYRLPNSIGWQSAWIDLSLSENELRKKLNGKWRNQLTVSEKSGLQFDVTDEKLVFDWLMVQYQDSMDKKDFKGVPPTLLSFLFENQDGNTFVMRAMIDSTAVASVLVATHGTSCTYLVGWNSSEGRKLNANNFLLWNAVIEMKKRGCAWFDVGGIDEINTPEITKFKRGLGGMEYHLVGDLWNLK